MRCLGRNKARFFYALYAGREPVLNASGRKTGEYRVLHGNPLEGYANISPAKGETQTRQFGEEESYDKVIVMDNDAPAIDEYSLLWVDRMPLLDEDGTLSTDEQGEALTPHDYVVRKVARSLNSVAYAVSKVNVSGN